MATAATTGAGPIWPPANRLRPFARPLPHLIAALLEGDDVQPISFHFGHVIGLPTHFREVAKALRDGRVTVAVNPSALGENVAQHWDVHDRIERGSSLAILTAVGRAAIIHECSHAVADYRARKTARRHEEEAFVRKA